MAEVGKTTECALLFPLKASLLTMKASRMAIDICSEKPSKSGNRLTLRRGSSMSELDRLNPNSCLSDLVRSSTATTQISNGRNSYNSLPYSPILSRSGLLDHHMRDSIGDLMNQKKYGSSSWSIRSETLVARTVPLSTVANKTSPPTNSNPPVDTTDSFTYNRNNGPLTTAQRTQRLSRLIKQQRSTLDNVSFIKVSTEKNAIDKGFSQV